MLSKVNFIFVLYGKQFVNLTNSHYTISENQSKDLVCSAAWY